MPAPPHHLYTPPWGKLKISASCWVMTLHETGNSFCLWICVKSHFHVRPIGFGFGFCLLQFQPFAMRGPVFPCCFTVVWFACRMPSVPKVWAITVAPDTLQQIQLILFLLTWPAIILFSDTSYHRISWYCKSLNNGSCFISFMLLWATMWQLMASNLETYSPLSYNSQMVRVSEMWSVSWICWKLKNGLKILWYQSLLIWPWHPK
jgi:hypothetical protein